MHHQVFFCHWTLGQSQGMSNCTHFMKKFNDGSSPFGVFGKFGLQGNDVRSRGGGKAFVKSSICFTDYCCGQDKQLNGVGAISLYCTEDHLIFTTLGKVLRIGYEFSIFILGFSWRLIGDACDDIFKFEKYEV